MIEERKIVRITCDKCGHHYDYDGADITIAKECARIYGWRFLKEQKGIFRKIFSYCPSCVKAGRSEIQAGNL